MQTGQLFSFGPYQLDPTQGQLWRGTQAVKITPKALAVLQVFLARPGQVLTKEEFFAAVWPGTVVSDAALTSCIQELRRVLRDDPQHPRYIETVHRRGYRFIAPLSTTPPVQSPRSQVPSADTQDSALGTQHSVLVGREAELVQLRSWLERALNGERHVVFVTGEPGIGKTTLVDAFLAQAVPVGTVWVGRGQSIEHYGAGEAYLPLLEAFGRLCREPGGQHVLALLQQQAPTWVVQMPALLNTIDVEALQRKVAGATKERMLRELAEAIESVTAEKPLVLVLEDLHWSDVSTLDWLAYVARRRERARLLVLGTYRPVEVLVREHPLKAVKQELQVHGQCQELALDFLREEDVAEYLGQRFPSSPSPVLGEDQGEDLSQTSLQWLAPVIHRRTDGNPLFMVNMVEHLLSQDMLVQVDGRWILKGEYAAGAMPESLRQMIEQRLARVGAAERRVLEVASVAGVEFSAAAVAAGGETTVAAVEEQCAELARRELFLQVRGTTEWPEGTVATRYGFRHALYQEVLYERIPASRRVTVHRQIGEQEEQAYGARAREIAAELAVHFEQGRDYHRAIHYLQQAGENALRRFAPREAVSHFTKGLELLKTLPDTPERTQQELRLQATLGAALIVTQGYGAAEVVQAHARVQELCSQVEETPQLFPILWGLRTFHNGRGEFPLAHALAEQCLRLAQRLQDPGLLLQAHLALGISLEQRGEFVSARGHLEHGIALYCAQPPQSQALPDGEDPGVWCLNHVSSALLRLGYPDQALKRVEEALTLARELAHAHTLANALCHAAGIYRGHGQLQLSQMHAEAWVKLAREQGLSFHGAWGTLNLGFTRLLQGQVEAGMAQICQGIEAYRTTGAELSRPSALLMLAAAYWLGSQPEAGLRTVAEALAMVERTGERIDEAMLWWLRGELTLQQSRQVKASQNKSRQVRSLKSGITNLHAEAEAEAYFHKAIEIARQQQAKAPELRATMSLARLWQQQEKKAEAHKLLIEIYGWFTEGFATRDLQEAKALLEELS